MEKEENQNTAAKNHQEPEKETAKPEEDLDIENMLYDISESILYNTQPDSDFEGFKYDVISNFGIETPFTEAEFLEKESAIRSGGKNTEIEAAITRPWHSGTTISAGKEMNPYLKPEIILSFS